ncbi:motility associated factor glycosyltransferase family protein [Saccharibacillus sacchari]|uniref:motility associated factor glycosyltransferase family protein n=1 Tax=Saccharibacillus sacchari TaxID=456493 RepID=UPI0004BABA5F|nr:6-hydroxymethylpterin diphosphokinase MptE-like protein [Saccharibacillus sacchari]
MSYFQANLAVLQERFPNTLNVIKQDEDNAREAFISISEPLEKDQAWLNAVRGSVGDMSVIFVYGFGNGIGLADLIEMYPDRFFIVHEPDLSSFHKMVYDYDFRELLKWPKLLWISVGESQLKILFHKICTYMNEELAFVALRHYLENDMDVLQKLKEEFVDYRNIFESNRSTEKRYQKEWFENSINQIANVLNAPSLFEFTGSLKGCTAVIVASGPSLEQDIEWIRELASHALVISAGSSIQALAKHGIRPHISAIMDGGEINEQIFSVEGALQSSLFYTSSAYYKISERKYGDSFHAVVQNDITSRYLLDMSENDPLMIPTPTVTGTAIQVAAWLGASTIVLTGQDLSFQQDKFYTSGVAHTDTADMERIVQDSKHHVMNVYGEYNRTNNSFLMMKDAIESLITSIPKIQFINATRGGAAIVGADWKPIEEVYEEVKNQVMEKETIKWLLQKENKGIRTDDVFQNRILLVKNRIINVLSDSLKLQNELLQIKRQIDKLPELSRKKAAKAWNTLEDIEKAWAKVVSREWFNPVFDTILSDRLDDFDRALPQIKVETEIRKKSDLLYQYLGGLITAIQTEIPWVQQLMQNGLARIERINDKG